MWTYDRGGGRCKHRWHNDYAGHERVGRRLVGKCPKSIDQDAAQSALDSGYEYFDERDKATYPSRIFAVVGGVVYRAMPTQPGVSYHGFPELAEHLPPDETLRTAILELAEADGSRRKVEKWLRQRP